MAYSEGHKHLLKKANARIIISYGRKHKLPFNDYIPLGFTDYMIDSGGFQFHQGTLQRSLTIGGYCLWLHLARERHGDVIKSWIGIDTNDYVESLEGYEKMRKEGLTCVPVWRVKWPDEVLDYLCSDYEYIAVGGVAFTAKKETLRKTLDVHAK